jgi:hypothetical protein
MNGRKAMVMHPDPRARNFGFGRRLDYVGAQALRAHFGGGHFATVQAHAERWRLFADWCRTHENIGDARKLDATVLVRYAQSLREAITRGDVAVATAHNRLSSVNQTLLALRGDRQMRIASPRAALEQARRTVRQRAPVGGDVTALAPLQAALQARDPRLTPIITLARASGMRLRETILADLPRLQREAQQHGAINIQDGTKGGRRGASAPRWVPVTDALRAALAQAQPVSPRGSRNLLAPGESYVGFLNRQVRLARTILHEHGLKRFHELRAAYACERYAQLTDHPAPVLGGTLHRDDRPRDRAARQQIVMELGHHRTGVVSSYIGGQR